MKNQLRTEGFFITGTDTDVGKTTVGCQLLSFLQNQGYKTVALKPVATGCFKTKKGLRNRDALQLRKFSTFKIPYDEINPFAFELPISPNLAAKLSQKTLTVDKILEACQAGLGYPVDYRIIEGAGGWKVPINEHQTMAEVAVALNFPIVLVVELRLGCLNHALLTYDSLKQSGVVIMGWVATIKDPHLLALTEIMKCLQERIEYPLLAVSNLKNPADTIFDFTPFLSSRVG